jgi:hypothetical protein
MLNLDVNKEWIGAIIDYVYCEGIKYENVFAHVKLIHTSDDLEDDYYEIMIPSNEFYTCYISGKKILKLLEE